MFTDHTICAPSTVPGTGAISVIRVSGADAVPICGRIIRLRSGNLTDAPGYSLSMGTVIDGSEVLDSVLVSVFRNPRSYTGEDCVEISCHASRYIVSRILDLLTDNGARMAEPGEFTRRAFLNGKMDLAQAEAVADVIASENAAAHRVAMNQLRGGYSEELGRLRASLLELAALLELELDFSEEDVEFADRKKLDGLLEETLRKVNALSDSFHAGNAIKNGVPVAIVGPVNAGKSTLLNALVGENRAIVTEIAGTTRDTVEEQVTIGGILFRFIDTAGLRSTDDKVESLGIERSYESIGKADIILAIFDSSSPALSETGTLKDISSRLQEWQKLVILANKSDKCDSGFELPDISAAGKLSISAKRGDGIGALKECLCDLASGTIGNAWNTLVTNARHYAALRASSSALTCVREGLASGLSGELVTDDLKEALVHIGSITGEISTDEVLGEIFAKFCIGK